MLIICWRNINLSVFCYEMQLSKVLVQLLKHQSLLSYKSKLIECARTLNYDYKDLIPQMLTLIKKLWSCQHLKTIVLMHTMMELYEWCDKDRWIQLQVQIVGDLSKLFSNNDFQVADTAMNFWNRLLHENIKLWKNRPDLIKIVVGDLKKVMSLSVRHILVFIILEQRFPNFLWNYSLWKCSTHRDQ